MNPGQTPRRSVGAGGPRKGRRRDRRFAQVSSLRWPEQGARSRPRGPQKGQYFVALSFRWSYRSRVWTAGSDFSRFSCLPSFFHLEASTRHKAQWCPALNPPMAPGMAIRPVITSSSRSKRIHVNPTRRTGVPIGLAGVRVASNCWRGWGASRSLGSRAFRSSCGERPCCWPAVRRWSEWGLSWSGLSWSGRPAR